MVSQMYIAIAVVGGCVGIFWKRVYRAIERRRIAAKYGCAAPAQLSTNDPIFGFDLAFKMLGWTKAGKRVQEMGKITGARNHTVGVLLNGQRGIWTTDPQNIKSVLATDWESFGLGFRVRGPTYKLMGMGVMGADGERWAHSRQAAKPTFNRAYMTNEGIKKHFDLLLSQLPRDGSTLQVADLFGRMGTDIGSEFVFGESTRMILPEHSERGRRFKEAFVYATVNLVKRIMLGPLRVFARDPKVEESVELVHNFVDECIAHAVERKQALGPKLAGDRHILVYDLLDMFDDRVALRHELLHVFLGATETLGIAMTNILFLVARNPGVWTKLRQEVQGVREEDLTFEKLKSLTYLQWTIKETLRLHPPAPTTTRETLRATTLPSGGGPNGDQPVAVAPGDMVSLLWGATNRRRDIYGDDADEFRPERWEHLRTTFEYNPFSGGPRVCPGQQLALFWVAYTLARLVLEVKDVENRDEMLEFVDEQGLAVRSRHGAKVSLIWA